MPRSSDGMGHRLCRLLERILAGENQQGDCLENCHHHRELVKFLSASGGNKSDAQPSAGAAALADGRATDTRRMPHIQ
jgi:hypothetical protein